MSSEKPDLYTIIGHNIREWREFRNMTQDELSRKIGLSRTSVTNIEAGNQRLPLQVIYKIAKVLRIEAYDILPLTEDISVK